MIGNLSILLFSSLFIACLLYYLYRQQQGIDILDVYIIFVLFHFGFYPFVRGLHFGRDIIFDFTDGDPLSIGLVFFQTLIILVILKVLSRFFLKDKSYLKINNFIENYSRVNNYVLYCIVIFLIIFQIYSYCKYGVQWCIQPWDFARIGKSLPYWFTSFRTIYNYITFCACLVLLSKVIKTQDYKHKISWIVLSIFFISFASMYGGKRFFISIIILSFIFYFDQTNRKIFQLRNLKYVLILVLTFFLFSNLFESYRGILERVGQITSEDLRDLKGPFSAAINYQPTLKFLARRPGTWEFSYLVLNKQIRDGIVTTKGNLLKEGLKSAIPRYFWHDKEFSLIDDTLAQLYGVKPKEIDIGKNNYGVAQVEFGFFSLVVVPVVILLLLMFMALLNKKSAQYPTFLWLFTGNILYYLINIEENGTDIFIMLRNIIFLGLLFAIYILIQKTYWILKEYLVIHRRDCQRGG